MRGLSIWDANPRVVEHLRDSRHLFHDHVFNHSYPHDWRGKSPVIFRATEQWFIGVVEKRGVEKGPEWWTIKISVGMGLQPGSMQRQEIKLTERGFGLGDWAFAGYASEDQAEADKLAGRNIEILWPGNDQWYRAQVLAQAPDKHGRFRLPALSGCELAADDGPTRDAWAAAIRSAIAAPG